MSFDINMLIAYNQMTGSKDLLPKIYKNVKMYMWNQNLDKKSTFITQELQNYFMTCISLISFAMPGDASNNSYNNKQ